MARRAQRDGKRAALAESGTLNGRAEEVRDELFQGEGFFDPRDRVQVKYEMLRRVDAEGASVTEAAGAFGFSRVAYYQVLAAFQREGLPGLVSKRPGPRRAHKLSAAVVGFVEEQLARAPSLRAQALATCERRAKRPAPGRRFDRPRLFRRAQWPSGR